MLEQRLVRENGRFKKIDKQVILLILYYEIKTRLLEQERLEKNKKFLECILN